MSIADHLRGVPVAPSQPNAPAPLFEAGPTAGVAPPGEPAVPIPPPADVAVTVPEDGEDEHKAPDEYVPPELEALLDTNPRSGLSTADAQYRLEQFGPNAIPEKKVRIWIGRANG